MLGGRSQQNVFSILKKSQNDICFGNLGNFHNSVFLDYLYFPLFGVTRKGSSAFYFPISNVLFTTEIEVFPTILTPQRVVAVAVSPFSTHRSHAVARFCVVALFSWVRACDAHTVTRIVN